MINLAMNTLRSRLLSTLAACLAAAAFCPAAFAADTPATDDGIENNSVRLGLYAVFLHPKADDISGPYVPPGTNLQPQNFQTLYLGYVRRLSSKFDVELATGWPPLTKTEGKGVASLGSVPYAGQVIATARWIAPTVLLEYKFLSENSPIQPYIGAGVNYTVFYDRNSTAQGNAATGGPTRLSLTSSVGPAATAGLRYKLGGHWNLYGSYSVSQLKSRLTADTAGVTRTSNINFGPQALVLSVGYSF